ncbi:MAG: hypothetical protein N5P05_003563 [Chroococcopsis gigantea SAG 12.99]|jgi:hypothetical protein|nr:hypothetical protein [Chroococcopsis gigantea SAG 12.99]
MRKYPSLYYRSHPAHARKKRRGGFGIAEIMIATFIAAVAISLLLSMMVSMMQTNQTEQARSGVSDDMRRAMLYMTGDIREATYVYNGDQLTQTRPDVANLGSLTSYLPSFGANVQPILAFWKVENLPYDGIGSFPATSNAGCATLFSGNDPLINECQTTIIERRAYTLVVYTLSTNNSANAWDGESRIERYTLRKYTNLATLTRSPGYVDPVRDSGFDRWPFGAGNTNIQVNAAGMTNTRATLVDFVSRPQVFPLQSRNPPQCPTDILRNPDGTAVTNAAGQQIRTYVPSPYSDPAINATRVTPTSVNSFFACVMNDGGVIPGNQDVIVYLTGNAKGRPGIEKDSIIDPLQGRVAAKGIVGKSVPD